MGSEAKTEAALETLSRDILNGTLPTGKSLRIAVLTAQYGIGAAPLREALARLVEQGLVVAEGPRDWRVAPASLPAFMDLLLARAALERALLEDVIAHGHKQWETDLVAAHYHLAQAVPPLGEADTLAYRQTWIALHDRFHLALLAGARSDWLKRFYAQVLGQMQRHHQAVLARLQAEVPHLDHLHAEAISVPRHTELMVTVLDRDKTAATSLLKAHGETALAIFRAVMEGAEPPQPQHQPASVK